MTDKIIRDQVSYTVARFDEGTYRILGTYSKGMFLSPEFYPDVHKASVYVGTLVHEFAYGVPQHWLELQVARKDLEPPVVQADEGAALAERFPKYWKPLPKGWAAIDTYRVNALFPIVGDDSGRLLHARKKLLVPGTRTGGKTLYVDIAEAHATLGAWLADNPHTVTPVRPLDCRACDNTGMVGTAGTRKACNCSRGKK